MGKYIPLKDSDAILIMLFTSVVIAGCPKLTQLQEMKVENFDASKAQGFYYQPFAQDPFQKGCLCPYLEIHPSSSAFHAKCQYLGAWADSTTKYDEVYVEKGITKMTNVTSIFHFNNLKDDVVIKTPFDFDNTAVYFKEVNGVYEEIIYYQCASLAVKKIEVVQVLTKNKPTEMQVESLKLKITEIFDAFPVYSKAVHYFDQNECKSLQ
eukprot:NODE_171_length_14381_cov_0.662512.p10 type:complete len:209 gc:universal NODE_171_length_14381_cov_0.662512:6836-6210(-)